MWEFDIMNNKTKEINVIFGYSLSDAFKRRPSLDPSEWTCLKAAYID